MAGEHKCSVCQATFTRPQHVARHMRSHTGDRPYKCQHCGDQFARSDLLSRHVNKCHPNEKAGEGAAGAAARRKGTASASRATTSKQACDQCVQSSLPCDGCNPCSKCMHRKLVCTFVKFHRQTAPSGPGHHSQQNRLLSGINGLNGLPALSASAPAGSRLAFPSYDLSLPYAASAAPYGSVYGGGTSAAAAAAAAAAYGMDDNVLLGPVEALYAQQQPPPPHNLQYAAPATVDYAAKFRAQQQQQQQQQAELMRRASLSNLPSHPPPPSQHHLSSAQAQPHVNGTTYWPYAQAQQQPQPHEYSSDSSGLGSAASSYNANTSAAAADQWMRQRKREVGGGGAQNWRSASTSDLDWANVPGAQQAGQDWTRRGSVHVSEDWDSASSGHGHGGELGGRSSTPSPSFESDGSGYDHGYDHQHHRHQQHQQQDPNGMGNGSVGTMESKVQDPKTLAAFAAQHPQLAVQHPDVAAAHPEFHSAFGLMSLDDPALAGIEIDDPMSLASAANHSMNSAGNPIKVDSASVGGHGGQQQQQQGQGVPSADAPFFSAEALSAPPQDPGATPMPRKGETPREQELRELREFWKQYMRTPLTGPQLDALTPSLANFQPPAGPPGGGGGGGGGGIELQRPPMERKRTRVNSMPSAKTPTADFMRMLGEQARQPAGSHQPHHASQAQAHPQGQGQGQAQGPGQPHPAQGYSSQDDLRNYEAAVMARNPSASLHLHLPRKERKAGSGSPPQLPGAPSLKEEAAGGGARGMAYPSVGAAEMSRQSSSSSSADASLDARPGFKRLASQTLEPTNTKAARMEGDTGTGVGDPTTASWDSLRIHMNGWPTLSSTAAGAAGSDAPPNISQTGMAFPPDRKIAGLPGASLAGSVGGGLASGLGGVGAGGAQGIRVRQRRMSAPITPTWLPVVGGSYPWGVGSGQPAM